MPAGNGNTPEPAFGRPFPRDPREPPPAPTREQYERKAAAEQQLQAAIKGQPAPQAENERQNRVVQAGIKAQPPAPETPAFLQRIENAAELLADVGSELGKVGSEDEQALRSFASALQQNVRKYVAQMIERKRRELADLERILGKF